MTKHISRAARLACLLIASITPAFGAGSSSFETESLTYKQLTGRLDQVHYDLRAIERNIDQFRKDFSSGLGNAATIRVLDIGVSLVRNRVSLNRLPRMIGAMDREGRTVSLWQRRKDELDARHAEVFAKHGELNRVVRAYAADLKERYGIDLERFFDAVESAMERGDMQAVERAIQTATEAARRNDANGINEAINQVTGGGPPPPQQKVYSPNDIVGVTIDPNDPNYAFLRFSDGTTKRVPIRRGPNGEIIFDLNGQQVTVPVTMGPNGPEARLPNGQVISVPGAGPSTPPDSRTTRPGDYPQSDGSRVTINADGSGSITTADGTVVYFDSDGKSIKRGYLGGEGNQLVEESEQLIDIASAASGQLKIRPGQTIKWQLTVKPTGQAPEGDGVRSTFQLEDRAGQGAFIVSGWRILKADGSPVGSGTGQEASAVVTQSGSYKIEFSGTTDWGSPFRVGATVTIAVQ
jgi:hypothetical protein